MRSTLIRSALAVFALLLAYSALAQDDLDEQVEAAVKEAVKKVAPSVVRIETVGGLENVGGVLFGTGPTTGLVVSEDGLVVSSAFNFAQKPSQILIGLPDGTRVPATLVATDHSRRIVLLKPNVEVKLPVPEMAPEAEVAVGQWAIAVGRTFEGGETNLSVGIVSAVKRVWGRAIQSDCKISPSNYGGPLVDIRGRVMGILSPMNPQSDDKIAGVEWYNAGIGFAAPLEQVHKALPLLKQGKDLFPGIMGVNLRGGDQFADPAMIAAVRANSPAAQAGLKTGDQILKIGDKEIIRQIQVREALGPHYAGETVHVIVKRGSEQLERDVTLIAKLEPYTRPFLGILPMRLAKAEGAAPPAPGVEIRFIYPDSPAEAAGLLPGDRILGVVDKKAAGIEQLREAVGALEPGKKYALEVRRGQQTLKPDVTFAAIPETVPEKLPPAFAGRKPFVGQQPPVGKQPFKLPEHQNDAVIYVPEGYDPGVPHALVVWFHEPNGLKEEEKVDALIAKWKSICEGYDVILAAPKSLDPVKWDPAKETAYVQALAEKLRAIYTIDDARIVAAGYQAGGAMAYHVAFNRRELFRGVVAVDAAIASPPPEAEPTFPLAIYATKAIQGRAPGPQIEAGIKRLRDLKYPVTVKDQGNAARELNAEELGELARWIDALDRI
ncbi:MAG: PDZ domain-containing protein [Planctomycetia bacterium]|nr:PDZ domain-containing protein [Planctomycetia bacterium]